MADVVDGVVVDTASVVEIGACADEVVVDRLSFDEPAPSSEHPANAVVLSAAAQKIAATARRMIHPCRSGPHRSAVGNETRTGPVAAGPKT
ncbi:MAG: hypothetical protein C0482_15425 [Gordonia sp.]|nr:hypothetical protein [Gordonia sp. (in: high G+C Gram-positive bacteria)]